MKGIGVDAMGGSLASRIQYNIRCKSPRRLTTPVTVVVSAPNMRGKNNHETGRKVAEWRLVADIWKTI
jgi:hypothetical protein